MQTVVLAAGQGTRMRPLTDRRPKPMLPVAGRPLVEHTLRAAVRAGATRLVVVVGYEADAVRNRIGDAVDDVPVAYAVQAEQRGTADAVLQAAECLSRDPFVVLNGDTLYDDESLGKLYDAGTAVASYRVNDPTQYGVLAVEGECVTGIIEKPSDPPSDLVNAGAYCFPATALDELSVPESSRGEHELTDVLEQTIDHHDVTSIPVDRWLDVGRPWELLEANEWKLSEIEPAIEGTVSDDATISGPVRVADGATVEAGVTIDGPALIQSGATVGPNAYIRGATLVGPDASVGHAVEVKNSVLMRDTAVNHLSYVGDSVLGRSVNFGAGTVVANLRHDDKNVRLTVKGDRVSTGRRKFGVVVGDGAKTGIDTSINAGVSLSTDARTGVGESVTEDR